MFLLIFVTLKRSRANTHPFSTMWAKFSTPSEKAFLLPLCSIQTNANKSDKQAVKAGFDFCFLLLFSHFFWQYLESNAPTVESFKACITKHFLIHVYMQAYSECNSPKTPWSSQSGHSHLTILQNLFLLFAAKSFMKEKKTNYHLSGALKYDSHKKENKTSYICVI